MSADDLSAHGEGIAQRRLVFGVYMAPEHVADRGDWQPAAEIEQHGAAQLPPPVFRVDTQLLDAVSRHAVGVLASSGDDTNTLGIGPHFEQQILFRRAGEQVEVGWRRLGPDVGARMFQLFVDGGDTFCRSLWISGMKLDALGGAQQRALFEGFQQPGDNEQVRGRVPGIGAGLS